MDNNSTHDSESLPISVSEYQAVFNIRGLQEKAHQMVMIAKKDEQGGYILESDEKAFDQLAHDLSEEIEFKLSPKSKLRHLARLYHRLRPDDFI